MANEIQNVLRTLPQNATGRKTIPIVTGAIDYFPLAVAEIARVSMAGNEQHNPGKPLHWNRGKSSDHADCIVRHLVERGTIDTDGQRHTAKVAWRALALLQEELEQEAGWVPELEAEERYSAGVVVPDGEPGAWKPIGGSNAYVPERPELPSLSSKKAGLLQGILG